MRIVIVWPGYTGYFSSCWRALAARADVRVYVEPSAYEQGFNAADLSGVWHRRVVGGFEDAICEICAWQPDLTLVCGWRTPFCRAVGFAEVRGVKALAFDMPWEWTLRKILARVILRRYLRRFDVAFVPGARCARYARWLGFRRVVTGSNPSGFERMSTVPFPTGVPMRRGFLFVGRFAPEKGLPFLLAAYRVYRVASADPEPLDLVGIGQSLPKDLPPGVRVVGFVPPSEMPACLAAHRALILPSRWEPWGVSAAEAMSAGLATILTDRCGLTADVQPTELVRFGDYAGLAHAMARVAAKIVPELVTEGERARAAVAPYADARWCERVLALAETETLAQRNDLLVIDPWEMHCVECGEPDCYRSCEKYHPSRTGRCERLKASLPGLASGTGEVRFCAWGKLELLWHGRLAGGRTAAMVRWLNGLLEPLALALGPFVYRVYRSVRWRFFRLVARRKLAPAVWRVSVFAERCERLRVILRDRDLRVVGEWPLIATPKGELEIVLPPLEEGALFCIAPEDGAASGLIRIVTNELVTPATGCSRAPAVARPAIKCVAWDLDGVLWDGTLSEGDQIRLRPGVLEVIRELDEAGVVSSICSRNDLEPVQAKLREFGIEDWFVFPQINWGKKSASLENLALELNISLDTLAFVDDRPENRADVRANCPGVRVWDERNCLEACRLEAARQIRETGAGGLGIRRRLMYREEMARRVAARSLGVDHAAFDRASGLAFELLPVEGERVTRCRELVGRTNRLNLTGHRYDVAAFAALLDETTPFAVRAWDVYGDYGIVGFVALRGNRLVECCFSCRSAGRGLERRVLASIAKGGHLLADPVVTDRNAPIRQIVEEFL